MRLPNGYGQICKLKGKRRKPYAVRISTGSKMRICVPNKAEYYPIAIDKYNMQYRKAKNDYVVYGNDDIENALKESGIQYRIEFVRTYRYLQYFERSSDAHNFLAEYNRGDPIKEHVSRTQEPDFKTVYDKYIAFAKSLNNPPSETTLRSYSTGYKLWKPLHDLRFRSITVKQLQDCLTEHGTMSKASVTRMITILKKMFKYAIAHNIAEKDLTPYLFQEHSTEAVHKHTIFTDEEIDALWKYNGEAAKVMLILIYTGMRCSEFLKLSTDNIHLDERYMIGGIKTEAGKNRIIPIHKRIVPIIRELYNPNNKYLFPNDEGGEMLYSHFRYNKWKLYNEELGMNHYTHDCRHTCSTKMEAVGIPLLHQKLILGHKVHDITQNVYTHVSRETLISDIDKIK